MTTKSQLPKYYQYSKNIRKQLVLSLPITAVFVVTIVYAFGLRNETFRTIILYMSLVYPAVIIFSLLSAIPTKLNYYKIDSVGVYVTTLGIIHKHIYWSDVGSIGPATIGNIEGMGMMYTSSFNRYVWGRKTRQKIWGWDEILAEAHTEAGVLFDPEVTRYFKKHLRAANRQVAKELH